MLDKYSIIIPTRERHETLEYAIKSTLSLDYNNLEVIVCDNASSNQTRDIVSSFTDSRLIYSRSNTRLSMTENFERGLSLASGDYITVIGDDDCIIPYIFPSVQNQLVKCDVVCWVRYPYFWNNSHDKNRGLLIGSLTNSFTEIPSKAILIEALQKFLNYQYLPSVYNSWISQKIINKIKQVNYTLGTDSFYIDGVVSPDVFSALTILCFTEKIIFSTIPFSLSGISSFSNGVGYIHKNRDSQLFAKEYGHKKIEERYDSRIKSLIGYGLTDDSLMVLLGIASDYFLFHDTYKKYIDYDCSYKLLLSILQSVIFEMQLTPNDERLIKFITDSNISDSIEDLFSNAEQKKFYQNDKFIHAYGVPVAYKFAIDARHFAVNNSYDAMRLYEFFLKFGIISLFFMKLYSKFFKILKV